MTENNRIDNLEVFMAFGTC